MDIDHSLGDFSRIFAAINLFVHCLEENPKTKWRRPEDKLNCIETFVYSLMLKDSSWMRPNLLAFIQLVKELKEAKKVESVHMYTAAHAPNPQTLAGNFFQGNRTSPQVLVLNIINNLVSSSTSFYDTITFTDGKSKSIQSFLKLNQRLIIIDDMSYTANYDEVKVGCKRKRQTKKRLPVEVCAHLQIPGFYASSSMAYYEFALHINTYFKDFSGFNLDSKALTVYTESLQEKFKKIEMKAKIDAQNRISAPILIENSNSNRELCQQIKELF